MKAIIYARVSSTTDRQSTERQVKDLTEYAHAMKYEVCKIFEEHISGGKKNEERPILQEALEYCKQNNIDMVLTSEISRLSRNAIELLSIVRELEAAGINLFIQKEQFTLLDNKGKITPISTIILAFISVFAENERESIKHRLNSGRKRYIEAGGKVGRPKGSNMTKEELAAKYKPLVKLLKKGMPYRKAAKLCDVSESTAKRVKKELNI